MSDETLLAAFWVLLVLSAALVAFALFGGWA